MIRALRQLLRGVGGRISGKGGGEDGNAVVEFLGVALILLLPVMYLVLALGRVQAGTFAAEGAVREAGRAFVTASTAEEGERRAVVSVALALEDQGFDDVEPGQVLTLDCSTTPCLEPGGEVTSRVRLEVPLPFIPAVVRSRVPLSIPVEAVHVSVVDEYRAGRP